MKLEKSALLTRIIHSYPYKSNNSNGD